MDYVTFAHSSWGPKYKAKGFGCQDYSGKRNFDDIQIIAIADGHGSNDCFRSDIGSNLAVKTAFTMINEYKIEGCFHCCPDQEKTYLDTINENMQDMPIIASKITIKDGKLDSEADHVNYDEWLERRQSIHSVMSTIDSTKDGNCNDLKICFTEDGIKSFKCQFWKRWRAAVKEDWDSKLDEYLEECKDKPKDLGKVIEKYEKRFEKVSEKYRHRYLEESDNYLYTAYGTTFLLALSIKSQILLLQIGDGTCVVMQRDGTFSVPVPADEDNFLNVTVSLCEKDAYKKIRHVVLDNVVPELAPVAVFLSSDGLDDCYPVYHNDKYLYRLYREILKKLSTDSSAKALDELKQEIKDSLLPSMTSQGSQDDISLAFLVDSDINALKEALSRVNLNDINPDYEDESEQNRKTDDEPKSKNLTTGCQSVSKKPKLEVPANGRFLAAEDSRRKRNYREAFEIYQKASSWGNVFAYYWLAWFYENGLGVKVDHTQADEYRKKALEGLKGISIEAINALTDNKLGSYAYILGWYYEETGNLDEAKGLYKSASELECEEAQYRLGCMALKSEPKQINEAKKWLGKAAKQGHVEANYELGKLYKNDGNYEKAKQYLNNAAKDGYLDAQYELYLLCKKHNEDKAKRFLYKAAYGGKVEARLEVIINYSDDEKDYERNINYYNDSIKYSEIIPDLKKHRAQFKLGCLCRKLKRYSEAEDLLNEAKKSGKDQVRWELYCLFRDVGKDDRAGQLFKELVSDEYPEALFELGKQAYKNEEYNEAERRFKPAAVQGHTESQYGLGCVYRKKSNNKEAEKWFKKAAEKGHAKAQYELSRILREECNEENKEYKKWLKLSADNGYSEAQYDFGVYCLLKGRKKEAEKYFIKAEKQDHVKACYELGRICYESGDMQKAEHYFNKAAEGECVEAWRELGKVYFDRGKFYDAKKCYRNAEKCYRDAESYYRQALNNGDIEAIYGIVSCIEKQRRSDKEAINYKAVRFLVNGNLEEFRKLLIAILS